jgi:hypothetical protein
MIYLRTVETFIHSCCFCLLKPGCRYVERWNIRAAGAGVQKIQDLFTNPPPPLMTKKLVVGVRRKISAISGQEIRKVNNISICTALIR